MSSRSMSAWGIILVVGLGVVAAPGPLRGQFGGGGVIRGGRPVPSEPASEVRQLAQENRDQRQAMQAKARALLSRLEARATELRESLKATEAEIAAAGDLIAEFAGAAAIRPTPTESNAPPGLAAPTASAATATVVPLDNPWEYVNNLAWRWATAPEEADRDGPKAVEFAKKACEITDSQNPLCLDTLAAAYAEVGEFDKAIATQAKALEVGRDAHGEPFKARLKLYLDGKPYRERLPEPLAPAPR